MLWFFDFFEIFESDLLLFIFFAFGYLLLKVFIEISNIYLLQTYDFELFLLLVLFMLTLLGDLSALLAPFFTSLTAITASG